MKYSELSDEKLAELAKSGDNAAFEALHEKYKNVVAKKCRKFFLKDGDATDLEQVGNMGLWNAVQAFDEKHGTFAAFASKCISARVLDAVRASYAKKKSLISKEFPIEECSETPSGTLSPLDSLVGEEAKDELMTEIDGILSKKEKAVFEWYVMDYSYREIAEKLGMTPKQTDNCISRFKIKITKLLKQRKAPSSD